MTFEEAIKGAMSKLAGKQELWIIEELKPMFDYDELKGVATLKQHYRFKFQEIEDYKQKVLDVLNEYADDDDIEVFAKIQAIKEKLGLK